MHSSIQERVGDDDLPSVLEVSEKVRGCMLVRIQYMHRVGTSSVSKLQGNKF